MLDPSIITRGAERAQLQQQQNMEALADLGGNLGRMVLGRKVNQMRQLKTPEEQQAFANKSLFSTKLNEQLRLDQAAAAKAANDQLKFNADLAKTTDETGKLGFESPKVGAETRTINIDNSVRLLENANQALKVAAQTGDPNAAKLALNNAYKAGSITPELYEQYSQQITSLSTKPGALKQFVQGIVLSGEKDAMKYIQPDQNAILGSETSIKTTGMNNAASKYVADTGAKLPIIGLSLTRSFRRKKKHVIMVSLK